MEQISQLNQQEQQDKKYAYNRGYCKTYYLKNKTKLNYQSNLNKNIKKYPFLENHNDAVKWVQYRSIVKKINNLMNKNIIENDDLEMDELMLFLCNYNKYCEDMKTTTTT